MLQLGSVAKVLVAQKRSTASAPKIPSGRRASAKKAANFIFNGGRTLKMQKKQEEKVGGLQDRKASHHGQHGSPEIVGESHGTPEVIR